MEQQPELLSREEILHILKKRQVPTQSLDTGSKIDLVKAYYSHVIPKPQREQHRPNRRGKLIMKTLRKSSSHRPATSQLESSTLARERKLSSTSSSRFLTSYNIQSQGGGGGDRLKPPPSAINFERKVIKLGQNKTTNNSVVGSSPSVTNSGCVRLKTGSSLGTSGKVKASLGSSQTASSSHETARLSTSVESGTGTGTKAATGVMPGTKSIYKAPPSSLSTAAATANIAKPQITVVRPAKPQMPSRKLKLTRPKAGQYPNRDNLGVMNNCTTADTTADTTAPTNLEIKNAASVIAAKQEPEQNQEKKFKRISITAP